MAVIHTAVAHAAMVHMAVVHVCVIHGGGEVPALEVCCSSRGGRGVEEMRTGGSSRIYRIPILSRMQ